MESDLEDKLLPKSESVPKLRWNIGAQHLSHRTTDMVREDIVIRIISSVFLFIFNIVHLFINEEST